MLHDWAPGKLPLGWILLLCDPFLSVARRIHAAERDTKRVAEVTATEHLSLTKLKLHWPALVILSDLRTFSLWFRD